MDMLERLAALEHEQWAHWTQYMLDNLTPENIARWRRQIKTPYEQLTEKEKESDRSWARKALEILENTSDTIYLVRSENGNLVWPAFVKKEDAEKQAEAFEKMTGRRYYMMPIELRNELNKRPEWSFYC